MKYDEVVPAVYMSGQILLKKKVDLESTHITLWKKEDYMFVIDINNNFCLLFLTGDEFKCVLDWQELRNLRTNRSLKIIITELILMYIGTFF